VCGLNRRIDEDHQEQTKDCVVDERTRQAVHAIDEAVEPPVTTGQELCAKLVRDVTTDLSLPIGRPFRMWPKDPYGFRNDVSPAAEDGAENSTYAHLEVLDLNSVLVM
jgi:hypothetical protein